MNRKKIKKFNKKIPFFFHKSNDSDSQAIKFENIFTFCRPKRKIGLDIKNITFQMRSIMLKMKSLFLLSKKTSIATENSNWICDFRVRLNQSQNRGCLSMPLLY